MFGGWDSAGRKRYRDHRKKIALAKRKPHVALVEKEALKRVRVDKGLESDCNAKKKGGAGLDYENDPDAQVAFYNLCSDDEELGQDEDEEIEDFDDTYRAPKLPKNSKRKHEDSADGADENSKKKPKSSKNSGQNEEDSVGDAADSDGDGADSDGDTTLEEEGDPEEQAETTDNPAKKKAAAAKNPTEKNQAAAVRTQETAASAPAPAPAGKN